MTKKTDYNPVITEITSDVIEAVLDSFLEDGLLKDVPIVRTCIHLIKTSQHIRDKFLLKKLIMFLKETEKIPQEEKDAFFKKVTKGGKSFERIGEICIHYLDRYDHEDKARIIGKLMRACIINRLTIEQYLRLVQTIDKAYIFDLYQIGQHRNARNLPRITKEQLYAIGLLKIKIQNKHNSFHMGNRGKKKKEMELSTSFNPESKTEYDYNELSYMLRECAL